MAAYLLALLIGLVLGLVGSGGSIITLPVLVYTFGIGAVTATTYSLFIVGTAALAGAVQQTVKRNVHFKSLFYFGLTSVVTVLLVRRFVLHALPDILFTIGNVVVSRDRLLMVVFAALMLMAVRSMWRKEAAIELKPQPSRLLLLLYGIVIGILTGLVGAGGGFLIVPALVLYAGLPIRVAIGTSLGIIAVNSFAGFFSDASYLRGIDWVFLLEFTGIAVVGIFIGAAMNKRIPSAKLKRVFAGFVAVMAVYILVREFLF
ncbi:MAG TPA: sulfite exporter TauE/SafE family protein [Chitinophagales bacterium]|nr:sulfite exporter TauE/SafE family protein [Chitinophagales bacterium]